MTLAHTATSFKTLVDTISATLKQDMDFIQVATRMKTTIVLLVLTVLISHNRKITRTSPNDKDTQNHEDIGGGIRMRRRMNIDENSN